MSKAGTFLAVLAISAPAWSADSTDARVAAFLKLIDRPRVPLAANASVPEPFGDLQKQRFAFYAQAGEQVPGVLVKRASSRGRLPVVIVLHGTGGSKESQLDLMKDLAGRNLLAVAIDGRYHGERSKRGKGSEDYVNAILRAYRTGKEHPFIYDTVWDLMRLIDYLETRSDVDPSRLGVIGFSKGGMETYLAAAVDPRIRVSIPCIGVQSFRWALDNDAWQSRVGTFQSAVNAAAADENTTVDATFVRRFYDRVAPGIHADFDGPAMAPLIAPRPLMVINGDSDARTPMPGLLECVSKTKKAYEDAGAGDKFHFLLQENTGHKVNPQSLRAAVSFFQRWLNEDGTNPSN